MYVVCTVHVLVATGCEGWVLLLNTEDWSWITKLQKAAGEKAMRKRWEKAGNTQSLGEWNMSRRREAYKNWYEEFEFKFNVKVLRELPEITRQRAEGVEVLSTTSRATRCVEQSKKDWDGDKSTTSRATGSVDGKTKQERLRRRQVNNESRATRDAEQNKASQYCWWKAETSHERADWLDDMSTIAILYFYVVARNGWPC